MKPINIAITIIIILGILLLSIGIYLVQTKTSDPSSSDSNHPDVVSPISETKAEISVAADTPWTSTNLTIADGQTLIISASGVVVWKNISKDNPNAVPNAYEECDPQGTKPNSKDYHSNIQQYQTPKANKGALIGKIGENGVPFLIGTKFNQGATANGTLFLGINEMRREIDPTSYADNQGYFQVSVQIKAKGETRGVSSEAKTDKQAKQITVDAQYMWTDTGIDVKTGNSINITASGKVTATTVPGDAANKWVGPDGWGYQPEFNNPSGKPHRWVQVLGSGSSLECMTAKVGNDGLPFKVGSSYTFSAERSGRLYLGVNHIVSDAEGNRVWENTEMSRIWQSSGGSFTAKVEIK